MGATSGTATCIVCEVSVNHISLSRPFYCIFCTCCILASFAFLLHRYLPYLTYQGSYRVHTQDHTEYIRYIPYLTPLEP